MQAAIFDLLFRARVEMTLLRLLGLIVPLALDTFAVSAAAGLTAMPRRHRLRLSAVFALFEGGMPMIGLALGGPLGSALGDAADYFAIAILFGFGLFTLLREEYDEGAAAARLVTASGFTFVLLGLSVSLDELAVGFTLGLLRLPVVWVLLAIAVQTFVASQLGFALGSRLSERFREGAEKLAGVAFIVLAAVLLLERLL